MSLLQSVATKDGEKNSANSFFGIQLTHILIKLIHHLKQSRWTTNFHEHQYFPFLGDCFVYGQLDIKKLQLYLLVKRKGEEHLEISIISRVSSNIDEAKRPYKKRKVRSRKKHRIEIPNPDGTVTYMEP